MLEVADVVKRYDGRVVLASHQMDFPPEEADRVLTLSEGHLSEGGRAC